MRKMGIPILILLLVAMALGCCCSSQAAEAAPATDDFYPTYRGFWDGHLWFSWTPGGLVYYTAEVDMFVDGYKFVHVNLDVYDPVLPQIWWRTRLPIAAESILVYRGFIGGIPIQGLPVTFIEGEDFHNLYIPIVLR